MSKSPVICAMLGKRVQHLAHPLNEFKVTQRLGTKEAMREWQESSLPAWCFKGHV